MNESCTARTFANTFCRLRDFIERFEDVRLDGRTVCFLTWPYSYNMIFCNAISHKMQLLRYIKTESSACFGQSQHAKNCLELVK
jgi:hypothetical protein